MNRQVLNYILYDSCHSALYMYLDRKKSYNSCVVIVNPWSLLFQEQNYGHGAPTNSQFAFYFFLTGKKLLC